MTNINTKQTSCDRINTSSMPGEQMLGFVLGTWIRICGPGMFPGCGGGGRGQHARFQHYAFSCFIKDFIETLNLLIGNYRQEAKHI